MFGRVVLMNPTTDYIVLVKPLRLTGFSVSTEDFTLFSRLEPYDTLRLIGWF